MQRWSPVQAGDAPSRFILVLFLATLLVMSTWPGPLAQVPPGAAGTWPVAFEEVSHDAGLSFQTAGEIHDPAGEDSDWPALPEIVGVGACWGDFDGDGYEDLYIANQRYNEKNPYAQGYNDLFDPTNRLFMNNGDGTFTDRTGDAGVQSRTFDYGCSAVDHDASGHVDLLVYGFGHIKLYKNNGDLTFTDVTQEAGLDISTACLPYECFTSCSAWVDYNGNGWLDLFVCTFVESDMEDNVRGPGGHVAQLNFLFRNNGDGTFTEVAAEAGVQGIAADAGGSKSWGAVWFDANLNGWPDLYVANDMTPNEFYWNNGDGTFTRDDDAGLDDSRGGMGVTAADTTRSGYPDVYITHYQSQLNGFYENQGDGNFLDRSGEGGLSNDLPFVGWGTHFVDLDRDGFMDVVAVNGHLDYRKETYGQETLVFRQEPRDEDSARWVDLTNASGPGVLEAKVSRGGAFADYQLDGNMDIFIGNNANQSAQLLKGSGNTNRWLYVQPVQDGPNHQAIGARVVVEAGALTLTREIQAGSSFLSQNSLLADFGLAQAGKVDRVTVHWPGGGTTVVEDLPVDRVVRIDRSSGDWQTDTLSPLTHVVATGEAGKGDWYRSAVDVVLVAEDRAVGPASGVATTEYLDDDGVWQTYEGEAFHFPAEEANHTLRFRSIDHAGNQEPVRVAHVKIDLTPPSVDHEIVGTPVSNGWWLDAELHLSAEDALSGVDRIEYRVDGGPWTPYDGAIPFDEGTHEVEYFAVDRAGNVAPVEQVEVLVDATPPELVILRPTGGTVYVADEAVASEGNGPALIVGTQEAAGMGDQNFTVHLGAQDGTSGVDRLSLWLNEGLVVEFLEPDAESVWVWNTSAYPAGTYLLQAVVQDRAGNVQTMDQSVVLVPASEAGVLSTITQGPNLYPLVELPWP